MSEQEAPLSELLGNLHTITSSISRELLAMKREMQAGLLGLLTTVNFDTDLSGNAIADLTRLDLQPNPYSSLGLSFSSDPPTAGLPVYARKTVYPNASTSSPNIISLAATPDGGGDTDQVGAIRITFSNPVSVVTVDVKVSINNLQLPGTNWAGLTPILAGYDSMGNLVATAIFPVNSLAFAPGSLVSSGVTLRIVGESVIDYVTLHCHWQAASPLLIAYWDNLRYS